MRRYKIRFGRLATEDLARSYEWGVEFWGEDAAIAWLDKIESRINERLSKMPSAFPLPPENDGFNYEIRQMVFGRYRVLFTMRNDEVKVLRIRGPFNSPSDTGADDQ